MKQQGMRLAGVDIEARSIGGIETCIQLPRMNVAFDIGRCPQSAVRQRTVLFTHSHIDHMGGITWHAATRGLQNLGAPTYVVPPENEEGIKALFAAARVLDHSELAHHLVPLGPGGEHQLSKNFWVRPFRALHVVPCQGYAIWERRKKLKPEYRSLGGDDIRRLRVEEGIEVTESAETPLVAFCGDTLIEVVEREEVVRRAKLLILECTFVDDRVSVEKCRRFGHIHLDELVERASLFENEAILLTHFSARYHARDIVEALEKKLPASLQDRVVPLLNGHR